MDRRKFLITSGVIAGSLGIGGAVWHHRWKYVVIHHSAGSFGNIEFLQRVHRERQPGDLIDAIPYHYIVGNGNGLGLGRVDSDWRQEYGIWGMHVSSANIDRNLRGIGICLIGNFETHKVPVRQYNALVTLTKKLMKAYFIAPEHVNGHGFIPGEATKCPGKHFPMHQFRQDIA